MHNVGEPANQKQSRNTVHCNRSPIVREFTETSRILYGNHLNRIEDRDGHERQENKDSDGGSR